MYLQLKNVIASVVMDFWIDKNIVNAIISTAV